MTAITFPNNPSSGDTHTAGNGIVYTYDGEKWTSIGTNSAGTWTRSGTEVSLTNAGDDLNVDSGTLFVDASTDRVGVGTSSPGQLLHIAGLGAVAAAIQTNSANNNAALHFLNSSGTIKTAFTCDTDTGAEKFYLSHNGVDALVIDSSQRVGIGTTTTQFSTLAVADVTNGPTIEMRPDNSGVTDIHATHRAVGGNSPLNLRGSDIRFGSVGLATTEAGRFDSSGRLLVGTSSSSTIRGIQPNLQLAANSAEGACISIYRYDDAALDANCPRFILARSGGTSLNNTLVGVDNVLGEIAFCGADGVDLATQAALIKAEVDGTPGANDMPGRLVFSTNAGSPDTSPTTRMTIKRDGDFVLPDLYNRTSATGRSVLVQSGGLLVADTSSIRYKTSVEPIDENYSSALLKLQPVWYRSTCKGDNPKFSYWGFIAEDVAKVDPRLVIWGTEESVVSEDGERKTIKLAEPVADGVAYDRFVPHLLNLIKRQKEQIEAIEARLSALEGN